MNIKNNTILGSIVLIVTLINYSCDRIDKYANSPERYEEIILQFESADEQKLPPKGAIVGVGSSSMRGWHENIQEDLAPLTIIPRGFGGSNMNDALFYSDRIVLKYKPRAIIIYEGDNDIAEGISPSTVSAMFNSFITKVHAELPQCRVYFLSIKPSINRWNLWPAMKEANQLIEFKCNQDERLIFVDVSSAMLNAEGNPREEIFLEDNLHMNRAGYVIWKSILRPTLVERELQFEKKGTNKLPPFNRK